jgi:hypothetical protein
MANVVQVKVVPLVSVRVSVLVAVPLRVRTVLVNAPESVCAVPFKLIGPRVASVEPAKFPVPVTVHVTVLGTVMVDKSVTLPAEVMVLAPARVAVFAPEAMKDLQALAPSMVSVKPFPLAVINTSVVASGTPAPPAPPSVADHVAAADQLPVAFK